MPLLINVQNLKEKNKDEIKVSFTDDPNVTELPKGVKKIVKEGSKEVNITGNGRCLIGTTAVHITGDEEATPDTARKLNNHLAKNRDYYLPKI